jgi:hypothetical protein
VGVTFVEADQVKDVGRIAVDLRLHEEFERAGLAAPRPHVTSPSRPPKTAPRHEAPRPHADARPRRRRNRRARQTS